MRLPLPSRQFSIRVGSVAVAALGVASNSSLDSPARLLPAVVLVSLGVAGVATAARDYDVDRLAVATRRWWTLALAAFLPYALVVAPASDEAAALGEAVAGTPVPLALEAVAGAVVTCAVAVTVLYGFASYGIHPGRPSPEERVLGDGGDRR